jgi:hypothetical protein
MHMIDLRIFKLVSAGRTAMTASSLHRWTMYSGEKVLNCQERINRCHSMNFEDYSFDVKNHRIKTQSHSKYHDELYHEDDIGIYILTFG